MALIERYLDITVNKVDIAVERVRLANLSKEPLYLCYSGGKDSKVVRRICEMAEVPFEAHYNLTTVCEKEKAFADYPKIKQNYINAFQRLVDEYDKAAQSWVDGEAVFDWWVYGNGKIKTHADQISIESLLDK